MDLSTKSVCVVDNGIFVEVARTLSKSFGKVYYTAPWITDFPASYRTELGEGFPEFDQVPDIWSIISDVDLFVFTDLYQGSLQEYLVSQGKRVWGTRSAEELELFRDAASEHLKELDIPLARFEIVTGMQALRKYIKSRGDDKMWVKINLTRGDTETFSVEGYDLAKNNLDTLESDLGPIAEHRVFIVDDDLPNTFDIAIDTFSIDGKYPSRAMLGIEEKDEGYICAVKNWGQMPFELIDIYDKISPTLEGYQYRNLFAIECRIGKVGLWASDPCCRFGSPVSELELNLISNLPEIMWEGADGNLIEPKYKAKYGCEILIKSKWANSKPLLIEFPDEYRDQIKLRYAVKFGEETWILPQNSGSEVGDVVAYGDNLDDCMKEVCEIGSSIKGTQVTIADGSIDKMKDYLKMLESRGIGF